MAHVEKTMFREYDIRGRVNDDELNATSGKLIGQAYGTFLHKRQVDTAVVGYDCRVGSEDIKEGVIEGLLSTGCNIIDLGMITTPMMYWAQYHFNVMGGAMITGSHNPKGWNGLKLAHGLSYTLIGKELEELLASIEKEAFVKGRGKRNSASILEDFAEDLAGRVSIKKPFCIVVDAG
ncbi:MAG: phosphomannomutase, partial [Candidatus Latescibacterota bacterium]